MHGCRVKNVSPQVDRNRKNTHHIGADGHKARLPQGKLSGKAVGDVHGQTDDGVNQTQVDDTPYIGVNLRLGKAGHAEKNDQSSQGEHDIAFVFVHDYTFSVVFSPNKPVGL